MKLNSQRVLISAAAVLTAAASAYLWWIARVFPSQVFGSPGPGVWPRIMFVLMFVVALYLALRAWRDYDDTPVFNARVVKVLGMMVLSVLYLVCVEPVGFLLTTGLYLFGGMWWLGLRTWRLLLSMSILFPIVVYVVFVALAHARFPAGVLGRFFGN